MSLQTRIAAYITRVGTEFKAIRTLIAGSATGDVSGLNTTATDLVAAINEVAAANGLNTAQVQVLIDASIASTIDGAPGALDTLNELAAALGDDANFAATVNANIAAKANSLDIYTRTDLGDPETDLVTLFNAAIA